MLKNLKIGIKLTEEQRQEMKRHFEASLLTAALVRGKISPENFTKIVEKRKLLPTEEQLSSKNRRL